MKDWIHELCPELEDWQVELIVEEAQKQVEAEREACADICDQHASIEGIAQLCASSIRARNQS